ncbi:MAG: hypothetical protein SFX73_23745 [Kofleriaceae bacterium]|nr:hypothetical protein [Kofleriaceae bacterium]
MSEPGIVRAPNVTPLRRFQARQRAVSIIAACTMVLAGMLALRHETAVAHVRDHATGTLHHAHALADHHEQGHEPSTPPHLHRRHVEAHAEGNCCALLGLQKSTVLPSTAHMGTARPAVTLAIVTVVDTTPSARAVYRLAPKTSPPGALALVV